jgi:hypothetical protein
MFVSVNGAAPSEPAARLPASSLEVVDRAVRPDNRAREERLVERRDRGPGQQRFAGQSEILELHGALDAALCLELDLVRLLEDHVLGAHRIELAVLLVVHRQAELAADADIHLQLLQRNRRARRAEELVQLLRIRERGPDHFGRGVEDAGDDQRIWDFHFWPPSRTPLKKSTSWSIVRWVPITEPE